MEISRAAFIIDINYSGNSLYQSAFDNAGQTWETLLGGYQNGRLVATSSGSSYASGSQGTLLSTVYVSASAGVRDGLGGILGSAGPTEIGQDQLGFILATDGIMDFDEADIHPLFLNGSLETLIAHELGHVLGFGTLWGFNNLYVDGSGEFMGIHATAAWQSEFGQIGTPDVELDGGAGTADGHWNENLGGSGLTGITDTFGRDMRDELMTGWLNSNSFISQMTVASFRDIGFTGATAVPEPSSMALGGIAAFGWFFRNRRKRVSIARRL